MVLVLPIDMDHGMTDVRQQIKWTETSAQVDPILSGPAHDPFDNELVVSPISCFLKPLADPVRQLLKQCLDGCLFFIVPDDVGCNAPSRDQA